MPIPNFFCGRQDALMNGVSSTALALRGALSRCPFLEKMGK